MNLVVATEFLKDTKVNIDTAGGGKEAVDLALRNSYDVILMDQRMPEMDGEEAFRLIRSHKDGPNSSTPVICLTADAVVGARERYLSKGFDDYLTKPIDSTSLEKMLKKYIPEEKITPVSATEEPATEITSEDDDPRLKTLQNAGIDTAKGLHNCGDDKEFYITILSEYLKGSDDKKLDLKTFLDNSDFENYGILIHSIKSSSATIGADAPYKLAQGLESAAKKDDKGYVLSNHDKFLKEYNEVLSTLREVVPSDDSRDDDMGDDGIMEFSPEGE